MPIPLDHTCPSGTTLASSTFAKSVTETGACGRLLHRSPGLIIAVAVDRLSRPQGTMLDPATMACDGGVVMDMSMLGSRRRAMSMYHGPCHLPCVSMALGHLDGASNGSNRCRRIVMSRPPARHHRHWCTPLHRLALHTSNTFVRQASEITMNRYHVDETVRSANHHLRRGFLMDVLLVSQVGPIVLWFVGLSCAHRPPAESRSIRVIRLACFFSSVL